MAANFRIYLGKPCILWWRFLKHTKTQRLFTLFWYLLISLSRWTQSKTPKSLFKIPRTWVTFLTVPPLRPCKWLMLQHIFKKLHLKNSKNLHLKNLHVIVYVKITWLRVCILSAILQYGGRLKIPSENLNFDIVCVLNKQFYDIFTYRAILIYQTVFSQFETKVLSFMNWNGYGTFLVGT